MIVRGLLRSTPLSGINNPSTPLYQALAGGLPAVDAGVSVTTTTAMRVMAVYACVRLIAETCAALPLKTYTGDGPDRKEVRLPSERYIWDQPNPEMTQQVFWEQMFGSALLDGNAFINTVRTRAGDIAELWPVAPSRVEIFRTRSNEKRYRVGSDEYTDVEMLHVPGFTIAGTDRGLSPIGQARQAIGLALAAEQFGARLFGSGSLPGGIIKTSADLSGKPEVAAALKARWQQLHAGVGKSWEIGVLDNGAEFVPLTIPPEDAQFLETRRFQISEIARLFRVPPHLIADVERSTSWGTGIEEQNIAFITYTLLPWLRRFEQAITKFLLPVRPRYAKFVVDGLLRGDARARVAYYGAGRRDGWLSQNDIRRLEDMPPIEDGDSYLMTPTGAAPNEPGGDNADTFTS